MMTWTLIQETSDNHMAYIRKIQTALMKYYAPILRAQTFEEAKLASMMLQPKIVSDEVRQLWFKVAPDSAEREYRAAMKRAGLKFGKFSAAWLLIVEQYLNDEGLNKLSTQIDETTRNWVLRNIEQGIAEGQGIQWLTDKLEQEFGRKRARTIARTETIRALNAGHLAAGKEVPFESKKRWSAIKDRRTRRPPQKADHFHMDGQEKEMDEYFADPISGALMMAPGDSSSNTVKGSDVINCRCRMLVVPKEDENGMPIMKR